MSKPRTMIYFGAHPDDEPLARLGRPGEFFDFTRYRPHTSFRDNRIEIELPNATISFGKTQINDLLLLHLPEPHMNSEAYIESVLEVLKFFNAKRYCLLGSVYDMVPHTRPLIVTGFASNPKLKGAVEAAGVFQESYEGPTTILNLTAKVAEDAGIETLSLVVHLQRYLQMDEDHRGEVRLLEVINELYGIPIPHADRDKAAEESKQIAELAESFLKEHPQLRPMLTQLEQSYDARVSNHEQTKLSPEIEQFLQKMSKRFEAG